MLKFSICLVSILFYTGLNASEEFIVVDQFIPLLGKSSFALANQETSNLTIVKVGGHEPGSYKNIANYKLEDGKEIDFELTSSGALMHADFGYGYRTEKGVYLNDDICLVRELYPDVKIEVGGRHDDGFNMYLVSEEARLEFLFAMPDSYFTNDGYISIDDQCGISSVATIRIK